MQEYSHIVIDKTNVGLGTLRQSIATNGIETAQQRGIQLATGSIKLQHHLHVFFWDESLAGVKGRVGIEQAGNCFRVKVRWPVLTKPGILFSGTLKGDGGHNGPPTGTSTNGAWAYKGSVPAQFCFVEGLHTATTPNFSQWMAGKGW